MTETFCPPTLDMSFRISVGLIAKVAERLPTKDESVPFSWGVPNRPL